MEGIGDDGIGGCSRYELRARWPRRSTVKSVRRAKSDVVFLMSGAVICERFSPQETP